MSIVFGVHNAGGSSVTNRRSKGFAKESRDGQEQPGVRGRAGRKAGREREGRASLFPNSFIAFCLYSY